MCVTVTKVVCRCNISSIYAQRLNIKWGPNRVAALIHWHIRCNGKILCISIIIRSPDGFRSNNKIEKVGKIRLPIITLS